MPRSTGLLKTNPDLVDMVFTKLGILFAPWFDKNFVTQEQRDIAKLEWSAELANHDIRIIKMALKGARKRFFGTPSLKVFADYLDELKKHEKAKSDYRDYKNNQRKIKINRASKKTALRYLSEIKDILHGKHKKSPDIASESPETA